jgi:hypothetical protein
MSAARIGTCRYCRGALYSGAVAHVELSAGGTSRYSHVACRRRMQCVRWDARRQRELAAGLARRARKLRADRAGTVARARELRKRIGGAS